MSKKVDGWIIVVIVVLAALLIANIFVSGTIFRSILGATGSSQYKALKLTPDKSGEIGDSVDNTGNCMCGSGRCGSGGVQEGFGCWLGDERGQCQATEQECVPGKPERGIQCDCVVPDSTGLDGGGDAAGGFG